MSFPLMIPLGFVNLHPHFVFESLAYFIGFRLYLRWRRPGRLPAGQAMWIVAGAILGAAIGSKVLAWLADPLEWWQRLDDPVYLLGGKTIVGGLLGGWIGVEAAKKAVGHRDSTGDDFVFPLMIGMAIGRIGCFLTGLEDHTHGVATALPWGVDFGDGVPRHPTQLYEILFLFALGGLLARYKRYPRVEGDLFRLFIAGYLAYRFAVDFLKPYPGWYGGLTQIQLACLAGLSACRRTLWRACVQSIKRSRVHA